MALLRKVAKTGVKVSEADITAAENSSSPTVYRTLLKALAKCTNSESADIHGKLADVEAKIQAESWQRVRIAFHHEKWQLADKCLKRLVKQVQSISKSSTNEVSKKALQTYLAVLDRSG
eukprot:3388884-Pyramimonas_sp.AAC.1